MINDYRILNYLIVVNSKQDFLKIQKICTQKN